MFTVQMALIGHNSECVEVTFSERFYTLIEANERYDFLFDAGSGHRCEFCFSFIQIVDPAGVTIKHWE